MQYEIEIKSLLDSQKAADDLLAKVRAKDPSMKLVSQQHQLNHYFKDGTLAMLAQEFENCLTAYQLAQIDQINHRARNVNVRTREKNKRDVLLVIKGALNEGSAAHGHHRMEFEALLPISIEELDSKIIKSGWKLEAKWQADRKIYEALGLTLDMVFTPGYGYFVEFEKVVYDDIDREAAHNQLLEQMESLGAYELSPDRLERMFSYYNNHWQEYYGTKKVFVVK